MQIQTIGDVQLVLRVTRQELQRRGLDPEGLELGDVLRLTRDACEEAEIPLRRTEEIEAYPERDGVLVFVHLRAEEKEWFRFACLTDALEAVAAGTEPDGELAFREYYYMSAHQQGLRQTLAEFGETASLRACGMIEEEATLVLDQKALKMLWEKIRRR